MVLIHCSLRYVLVEGQGKLSQGTLVHCRGLKEGFECVVLEIDGVMKRL
jgi:hypothetical protein